MNPYEQEQQDKDPMHIPSYEIEKRIRNVTYLKTDYDNVMLCELELDNGFRITGRCDRLVRVHPDVAQSVAYADALDKTAPFFAFMKAEHRHWINEQAREAGMLAALGTHGGD